MVRTPPGAAAHAYGQQVPDAVDQGVEIDRLGLGPGSAAEAEQIAAELHCPARGDRDLPEDLVQLRIEMLADVLGHLRVSDDYPQQVLEVMGDTAGQLPNGLQALGLPQFGLQRTAVRLRADELGRTLADPFLKARVKERESFLGLPGHGPRMG